MSVAISSLFDPSKHIGRDDGGGAPLTSSGSTLAGNCLSALRKAYPVVADGWRVWVNEAGGLVIVKNALLSGDMGFMLPVNWIDTEYRAVTRAGGELLERYRIARAGAETLIQQQILSQPRDFRGSLRADT